MLTEKYNKKELKNMVFIYTFALIFICSERLLEYILPDKNNLLANNFTSCSEISELPKIIKRSTTFLNSRIFPVQSYSCNNFMAVFEKFFIEFPCSKAIFEAKCSINAGISSLLSFKAGTLINITANR